MGRGRAGAALLAFGALGLGLAFGAMGMRALTAAEREGLAQFLLQFWGNPGLVLHAAAPAAFRRALAANLKVEGLLYLLGISVAGIPLVPVVLFFRGFVAGFALAAVATAFGPRGPAAVLTLLVPGSLLLLPAWWWTAGQALGLSWRLVHRPGSGGWGRELARFTALAAVMAGVVTLGTAVQCFLSPLAAHWLGL
ncbi:Stage II sporulation protein M (SpoIIM) [Candidatus Hydrogenisulfobacillus filiaventi]|uniref:Stage II sporulation protein M (SpoIIM) n=1 Tax=Candidatus Hydrogenisulfobacillus filiaventi TaxID=2707344 RepID=A0A6F8ZF97_9FIRM|nr:Stage II sporulation protein M (SpoIIM) [Candidatus Hydrogenisulfobacillus filiaventi]